MNKTEIPCEGKYYRPLKTKGYGLTGGLDSRRDTQTLEVCIYERAKNERDEIVELLKPRMTDKRCDVKSCPLNEIEC